MILYLVLWGMFIVVPVLQMEYDLYRWWLRRRDLYLGDFLHEYSGIFNSARLTEWVDSPDPLTGLYHVPPATFAALPRRPRLRGPAHPAVNLTNLAVLIAALVLSLSLGAPQWLPLALAGGCIALSLVWQVRLLRFYRLSSGRALSDRDVDRMTGLEFMIHVRREHFRAGQARSRSRHAREFSPSMRLLHRAVCARRHSKWQRVIDQWGGDDQVDAVIAARMETISGLGTEGEIAFVNDVMRDETCRDLFRRHIERARFAERRFGRTNLYDD